jgi:3-hydroxybutyryl-CoA dehydrogenase
LNPDVIRTIAVLGAGTMGNGIAHVFARFLDRALQTISKNLDREGKKDKISEAEKPSILARIEVTTKIDVISRADFLIEAVPENLQLKTKVLAEADRVLRPEVVIATNTSSISITALAAGTQRPDRFIGMHFMNPVPMMPLVEVIRALQTSSETFENTMKLCEKLGKKPVAVSDSPGFVSNRVLMPLINEAAFCVMEGVAKPEAVDAVMRLGMNHPMGPLELADFIGLDVCLDIMEVLFDGFGDSKFHPCPLLKKMVAAGWLGKKSGRGFYVYGIK